jgi:flagellar basal body-associated protein FliL
LRKRSRIITILLLPLIVFVFIIGWAMYWIGKQRSGTNGKPQNTAKNAETNEEDDVKIGVIEELMEKQLKAEQ